MALVSVLLGIIVQPLERQRAAVETILTMGGSVEYRDPSSDFGWEIRERLDWLPWHYFGTVVEVDLNNCYQVTDSDLRVLQKLPHVESLWLAHTKVTDVGLVHARGLARLKFLWLDGTHVTEAGAAELGKALPNCEIYARRLRPPLTESHQDR